jgi:hypothetical protein
MLRAHLDGLLAWTRLRVSNGALENAVARTCAKAGVTTRLIR